MAFPEFRHIHCSSRFDRSAASLESDLDTWMKSTDLITLTEISNDRRAVTMREKGWNYFNAKKSEGQDECGIAWRQSVFHRSKSFVLKLNNEAYYRLDGRVADPVVSCTILLRHARTGHRLLVSVTHMPAHVEGQGGWRTTENKWRARKNAYLSSLANWAIHIHALELSEKPDAVLVIADWNLNLKEQWVRTLLKDRFTQNFKHAWVLFPTAGGSLSGGPVAPLGSPGKGTGDRIIDGTLYKGVKVMTPPNLGPVVKSSDHRPYHESFQFAAKAGHPELSQAESNGEDDTAHGDVYHGEAWWSFGDYMDDEIYTIGAVTGEAGGEVV